MEGATLECLAIRGQIGGRVVRQIGVARERIDKVIELDRLRLLDLLGRAVANEDRLAAPHHGDGLALLDGSKVHIDAGQRQGRGVRVHLIEQRPQHGRAADRSEAAGADQDHIAARRVVIFKKGRVGGRIGVGHGPRAPDD